MKKMKGLIHHKKLVYCLTAAIMLLAVSFIIMLTAYFRRFDRTLEKENEIRLSETAQQIASHTLTIVKDTETSLRVAADAMAAIQDQKHKISYLSSLGKKPGIVFTGYAGRDGILRSPDMSKPENISKEAYFIAACGGKTQVTNIQRKILKDRAVSGIIFSMPVYDKNGNTNGALIAMMDIKKLQDALDMTSFSGNGYAYMIDTSGELILRTKSMDYNNYFTVLDSVSFSDGFSAQRAKSDITAHKKGMILYNHLGTDQYAYYQPLGFNGWTVISIVAKDTVSANTAALSKELTVLIVACVAVFILLLTSVVISLLVSKNQRHIAEMKSTFLANMSHEIRTPMNAVTGVTELLLRESLSARQREYVQTIAHSSNSLLSIINDVLDFSKIDSGKFTLAEEEYSLKQLIMDVTTLAVLRIGDKPVHFFVDLDEDLPARFFGDEARVKQIMVNLLGNAAKFTEKGFICLYLYLRTENGRSQLVMTVEDSGIGIKKQDMHRLFHSFEQVNTHYSHSSGGTGLGLAISKNLAEMMNGSIRVESTYGKGSSFTAAVCQKPSGNEKLFSICWPHDASLAVYEPDKNLCICYKKVFDKCNISYRLFSERKKFIDTVGDGDFQYVLADKSVISELEDSKGETACTYAVLLHQGEESCMTGIPAVYSPLFYFGLEELLQSENHSKAISMPSGQFDISAIRPIPEARVLLVDDNKINLEVAEALMSPYQMQIDCVLSGKEAVHSVQQNGYDMIFLDHMMPEMDGIETLKAIRGLRDPKKNQVPVIALTANVTKEAQDLFRSEGFDGFMPKPVDIRLLDEFLHKFIRS